MLTTDESLEHSSFSESTDYAEKTSGTASAFLILAAATGKSLLPIVNSLNGTTRQLVTIYRRVCRPDNRQDSKSTFNEYPTYVSTLSATTVKTRVSLLSINHILQTK